MEKNTKILLVMVLLASSAVSQYAQHASEADSLEYILQTDPPGGDELLQIYDDLSWLLMVDNYNKAVYYAKKGIALADKNKNRLKASQIRSNLGGVYTHSNRFDSALIVFQDVIRIAEQLPIKNQDDEELRDNILSKTYGNIGNAYGRQGKDIQALHYYLKAKDMFEKQNNSTYLTILYGNIGQLYINIENYELALVNLKKAEEELRLMNDSIQLTYVLDGLCTVYCHQLEAQKALECAELQYLIHSTHPRGTTYGRMLAELSLSNAWATKGDLEKAKHFAKEAFKKAEQMVNPYYQAVSLARIAKYCLYNGDYREGRKYAELSLHADTSDVYRISRLYNVLSATEFALGNYMKARDYHSKFEGALQERVNKQYHQSLLELDMIYETEKKEMEIAALKQEKQLMLLLAITSFGLALLVLALLLFRNRLHRKEKQLLAAQSVLDGETTERIRLARDLHDGLGSILTGVKLNLESIKEEVIPEPPGVKHFNNALQMLNESMLELRRVAHHLMPDSLNRYGLKVALSDFFINFPAVEFDYFGNPGRIDPKMEVMIYRIIHELVNNALKHSGASHVMVQLMREKEYIAFIVRDNGCGFDTSAETQGTGLRNIRDRVASYGGRMEIHSKPNEGTEINVEFKIENEE